MDPRGATGSTDVEFQTSDGTTLRACALAAAALDRRIKAVVAVCPAVPLDLDNQEKRNHFLAIAMRDNESRARGNPPLCMALVGLGDHDGTVYDYRLFRGTETMSVDDAVGASERIPGFYNQIPIRAFYNMMAWPFEDLLQFVAPTPRKYGVIYGRLTGLKELYVLPEKGHMDVLHVDERFDETVKVQVAFFAKYQL
ncbi:hypothetical protein C8A03DRAFT_36860 [Achaetomium macrosporum]|uniref:Uncharacterized protein n=1 Tax=Achaetomium macrosporum TaxID=79813 RepID=A0AAN7HBV7_9PEZI|nr:hypothetical protein C8A03DRAFT_36860 [Achaetomium macrosporum]